MDELDLVVNDWSDNQRVKFSLRTKEPKELLLKAWYLAWGWCHVHHLPRRNHADSLSPVPTRVGHEPSHHQTVRLADVTLPYDRLILATGGGAYMNAETRAAIADSGVAVWLKAELPMLMRRVMKRANRPLLQAANPEDVMRNFMTVRYPIYATAHVTVESQELPHDAMASRVIEELNAFFTAAAADHAS